ncbi:hypothetical protein AB0L88_11990 [Saccharopolyspora shandongensis]|uniref:hypothetical protein n=1 Tax=Saccharopolyspora shandongensis TaxID=418495 RepID=UPI003415DCA3
MISWLEDNETIVLGVKATEPPYPGQDPYGVGYPAVVGGTSEMTDAAKRSRWRHEIGPIDDMARSTLEKEVDEELKREYRFASERGMWNMGEGAYGNTTNRIWTGYVSPTSAKYREDHPLPSKEDDPSFHENERVFTVTLTELQQRYRITSGSSNEEVLRAVAEVAGTSVPDQLEGNEQAEIYLAPDNYPLQALANQIKGALTEREQGAPTAPE